MGRASPWVLTLTCGTPLRLPCSVTLGTPASGRDLDSEFLKPLEEKGRGTSGCRQEGWVGLCEVPTSPGWVAPSLASQEAAISPARAWAPPNVGLRPKDHSKATQP